MKTKSEKFGRNDPCPCGSGLKYKKCCLGRRDVSVASIKRLYEKKYKIRFKTEADIAGIRKAGDLVIKTLDFVTPAILPGTETEEINRMAHEFTIENGAKPAPLGYRGYPKSVCVSINEVICHGIPGQRRLQDGDIVNIDVTSILDGYYADASKTFFVGTPGPDAQKIVNVARESLRLGLEAVKPGHTVGYIGAAIQKYAEGEGCSVVREFVGHGVGLEFHESPQIPHYGKKDEGVTLMPGMVFTIEPMINLGGKELRILDDNWTAVTMDGSLSAQFEQTVLVTEDGFESLTPYDL
jgi:methionyl aminopeptidase